MEKPIALHDGFQLRGFGESHVFMTIENSEYAMERDGFYQLITGAIRGRCESDKREQDQRP